MRRYGCNAYAYRRCVCESVRCTPVQYTIDGGEEGRDGETFRINEKVSRRRGDRATASSFCVARVIQDGCES